MHAEVNFTVQPKTAGDELVYLAHAKHKTVINAVDKLVSPDWQ